MSSATATSGLTWEQFLELPDDPRYKHAELVDGELILVNPPTRLHQYVVGALYALIWNWIRAGSGRGEVTMDPPVQVSEIRGYLPDVAWFSAERALSPGAKYFSGAPDLAIEVLSPSTRAFDLVRKRADYERVGVRELWLVDPDAPKALVLRASGATFDIDLELAADGDLTSPLLPGLVIPLHDLLPS